MLELGGDDCYAYQGCAEDGDDAGVADEECGYVDAHGVELEHERVRVGVGEGCEAAFGDDADDQGEQAADAQRGAGIEQASRAAGLGERSQRQGHEGAERDDQGDCGEGAAAGGDPSDGAGEDGDIGEEVADAAGVFEQGVEALAVERLGEPERNGVGQRGGAAGEVRGVELELQREVGQAERFACGGCGGEVVPGDSGQGIELEQRTAYAGRAGFRRFRVASVAWPWR